MIATSIRNNSVTAVVNNKVYTVDSSNPNYTSILDAIRNNDESELVRLMSIKQTIIDFTEGRIQVSGGEVTYNGRPMGGPVVERLLGFIKDKLPVTPLLRFMNKMMENPSKRAVEELYTFLEHRNLPITPDGNILAYKGLQSNFYSIMGNLNTVVLKGTVDATGHILNEVGAVIEIARNSVCDDKEVGCAEGLHAGSLEYATGYAQGKMVIVEINPKDVVSIPQDCGCQKMRSCGYTVVGEFEAPLNNTYCNNYSDETFNDDSKDPADNSCGCGDKDGGCGCESCETDGVEPTDLDDIDTESEEYKFGVADGRYDSNGGYSIGTSATENLDSTAPRLQNYIAGYYDGYYV